MMAAVQLLTRLETRAVTAEQIIITLKREIEEIRKARTLRNQDDQIAKLKRENEQLTKEVENWTNKLIKLEVAQGIEQIPVPANTTSKICNVSESSKVPPTICQQSQANSTEKVSMKKKDEKKTVKEKKEKVPGHITNKLKSGDGHSGEDSPVDVGRLDLRIGCITAVKKHPDADSLYVEDVDVGEERPRTVVSGLVKHVPLNEMQNRMVVLLCNLKPAKMRGVTSEAMVMCASTAEKVEILFPPEGSVPGDLVHVEGYKREPDSILNPKKKIFETVAPDLKTNDDRIATYKGAPLFVPGKGMVIAPSLKGVNIK